MKDPAKEKAAYDRDYRLRNRERCNAAARDYWQKNKERIKIVQKEYRQKNKERLLAGSRIYKMNHPLNSIKVRSQMLKCNYGISIEEYNRMLARQSGVCAICGNPETMGRNGKVNSLSVDHNHETNKVRGLLCRRCNTAIGGFEDNKEMLWKAVEYLLRYE